MPLITGDEVIIRKTIINNEECWMFFKNFPANDGPFNLISGCKIRLLSTHYQTPDEFKNMMGAKFTFVNWSDVGLQIVNDTYNQSGSKRTFANCLFQIV